jgi:hypothetical protein
LFLYGLCSYILVVCLKTEEYVYIFVLYVFMVFSVCVPTLLEVLWWVCWSCSYLLFYIGRVKELKIGQWHFFIYLEALLTGPILSRDNACEAFVNSVKNFA